MKNKKAILLLLPIILIISSFILLLFTFAVPKREDYTVHPYSQITPQQALLAAKARINTDLRPMFPGIVPALSDIHALKNDDGETTAYLVLLGKDGSKGYILLSAVSDDTPIIAFSSNRFDDKSFNAEPGKGNPFYQIMKEDVSLRRKAFDDGLILEEKREININKWNNLIKHTITVDGQKGKEEKRSYSKDLYSAIESFAVSDGNAWADDAGQPPDIEYWPPLGSTPTGGWVLTNWHQRNPYNNNCPIDPVDHCKAPAGCTAIGIAQIINYYKFIGDQDFYTMGEKDKYLSLPHYIPIDDALRDPDSGQDFLSFNELNNKLAEIKNSFENNIDLDDNHISALCFACGIASKTGYCNGSSGASSNAEFLINKFGYTARNIFPDDDNFLSTISDNIKDQKIVGLSIQFGDQGHFLLCDGVNSNGEYHFNSGWGDENFNTWYALITDNIRIAIVDIEPCLSYGTIYGTVTSNIEEPGNLKDIEILVENTDGVWRRISPDASGRFRARVIPGIYNISCAYYDYRETIENVAVQAEEMTELNFSINLSNTFIKISEGFIVNDGGRSTESCWGDYNNDGYIDAYITNFNGENNFLYQNNGNGTFTKITQGSIVNDGINSYGAAWGDYDNDGDLDIAVANLQNRIILYRNGGDGGFAIAPFNNEGGRYIKLIWGDYNNDDKSDLFICTYSNRNNFLYENNGNGTFTKIAQVSIVNDGGSSTGASWGDYDNDGDLDIFVANDENQNNFLYRNDGNGIFTKIMDGDIVNDGGSSTGASWGDYDNDGDLDIFVANAGGQNNFLYQNNGDGTFAKITDGTIVNDGGNSCNGVWGDYNNDGKLDLFVVNSGNRNQDNFLYRNDGNGTFTKITQNAVTNERGPKNDAKWIDYDNDGDLDIYIVKGNLGNPQNNVLFENRLAADRNWLKIKLRGITNKFGLGAKVRVTALIDGENTTQLGQAGVIPSHFGLGDAPQVDEIRVEWLSGKVNVLRNISVNQVLTISEDTNIPTANEQNVTTNEETPLQITLTASDLDGDSLTYRIVSWPMHGTLNGVNRDGIVANNPITYTPMQNYFGEDAFSFTANDGKSDSDPAGITINVNPVNDAPVANAQSVTTNKNTSLAITLTGTDPDNTPLASYTIVIQPVHGTLSGTPPNVIYRPSANYAGADSFTFKVNDGRMDSNTAPVNITVNSVNNAPITNNQSVTTNEDTAAAIILSGRDPDGDPLTYTIITQPSHGTLNGTAPNMTYTPAANYNGADSFTFKVNDGRTDSNTATISITVNPVNDRPVANPDTIDEYDGALEDTEIAITLTGTDVDGDNLTYREILDVEPGLLQKGTLTGTPPNLIYKPDANRHGLDTFYFVVNDGTQDSELAMIYIYIYPINDLPQANDQSIETLENTGKRVTLTGTDVDEDSLTYEIVSNPANGTLTGTPPSLIYRPNADYVGMDSFTFKCKDRAITWSNTATISIRVKNAPPPAPRNLKGSKIKNKQKTSIRMQWDGVIDRRLAGYNVYIKLPTGRELLLNNSPVPVNTNNFTIANVKPGIYNLVVKAADNTGLISDPSNTVTVKVP